MKQKMTIVSLRRNKILEMVEELEKVNVNDLARIFEVSELTIRRDLDYLVKHGKVNRFHGGASKMVDLIDREPYTLTMKKNAIAKKAAEYIQDDDTIFINSSSTALLILKYLADKRVTAITNNCRALSIEIGSNLSLVLTGGNIRFPKETLIGEFALNNLSKVSAAKAIMGVSGLHMESGITTQVLDEVAVNEMMFQKATQERIVLADSSKLNKQSTFVSGKLTRITTLITDKDADLHTVEKLERLGIRVILVDY